MKYFYFDYRHLNYDFILENFEISYSMTAVENDTYLYNAYHLRINDVEKME